MNFFALLVFTNLNRSCDFEAAFGVLDAGTDVFIAINIVLYGVSSSTGN